MSIKETTVTHSAWVGAMGWHDKQLLEYLALIGSEIGEAVAEAPNNVVTKDFGSEVIDIVLRIIDCTHMHGVNLLAEAQALLGNPRTSVDRDNITFGDLAAFARMSPSIGAQGTTVLEKLAYLMPDLANAMNDCRGVSRAPTFGRNLTKVCMSALRLALEQGVDVDETLRAKIEKNALKGNKGRRL